MADGASTAAWEQLVAAHYANAWGRTGEPTTFDGARALNLPPDFTVLAYSPSNIRPFWTYATCGMSQPADASPIQQRFDEIWEQSELAVSATTAGL